MIWGYGRQHLDIFSTSLVLLVYIKTQSCIHVPFKGTYLKIRFQGIPSCEMQQSVVQAQSDHHLRPLHSVSSTKIIGIKNTGNIYESSWQIFHSSIQNTPEHHDPRHQSINKSVTVEAMKSLMLEEQTQE